MTQSLKGLGTVSINIAKNWKFRHLQNFWLELFVQYPQCIEVTFVLENARAYCEYRIQNRSNFPDFLKFQ